MNRMLKRVTFSILILLSLMIGSSLGEMHVTHEHGEIKSVQHNESRSPAEDHCSGETLFDHLFECIGGISSRELADENFASNNPSDETGCIILRCDTTFQIKRINFFNEYNPALPHSHNPHAFASRAPPQPV